MDKVHVYMWLHTASIKSTAGNQTMIFPSPFYISISSRLTFIEAFRNDQVADCSTTLRSATEENESGGYLTVPFSSKVPVRVVFCHHVRVSSHPWAIGLSRVARKLPHFGIGIVQAKIPMSFPVF